VIFRASQSGAVDGLLPSQILPAAALIFAPTPQAFPDVSPESPAILEIGLTQGAVLSHTLATGELSDLDLLPEEKQVLPLAVCEFAFNRNTSAYEPVDGIYEIEQIGWQAVQLFRYVAGEDRIWIRLTESTATWQLGTPDNFLGFAVGLGAGVWPPSEYSNWGTNGINQQENTQFFADIPEL